MSDTQRTRSELLSLLPSNQVGSITAQTQRDALISVLGGYGSCFVDAGSGGQVALPGGIVMGQFTGSLLANGMAINAGGATITVAVAGDYSVDCRCEFIGVAGETYTLSCGTGLTGSAKVNAAADLTACAFANIVTLTAGQVLTLKVSNANSTLFQVKSGHWLVKRVG